MTARVRRRTRHTSDRFGTENVGVGAHRVEVLTNGLASGLLLRYLSLLLIAGPQRVSPPAFRYLLGRERLQPAKPTGPTFHGAALVDAMRDNAHYRMVRRRARKVA